MYPLPPTRTPHNATPKRNGSEPQPEPQRVRRQPGPCAPPRARAAARPWPPQGPTRLLLLLSLALALPLGVSPALAAKWRPVPVEVPVEVPPQPQPQPQSSTPTLESLAVASSLGQAPGEEERSTEGSAEAVEQSNPLAHLSEEEQMRALLGFGGFDSTKGKSVEDNARGAAAGGVRHEQKRDYRQYMNRRGGFNRPLDKK